MRVFLWEDGRDGDAIDMAFNKDRTKERKSLIERLLFEEFKGVGMNKRKMGITYREYFENELGYFSKENLKRVIPNLIDGLKLTQRKIMFTAFKRDLVESTPLERFANDVVQTSAYLHSPECVSQTIIRMAQEFVGSNNINLFHPRGNFGSRRTGRDGHGAVRYLSTNLTSIARFIFPKDDDNLLESRKICGKSIEPTRYAPIIPFILVNGTKAIGSGWNSFIPNYDPRKLCEEIRHLLQDDRRVPMDLDPWYREFEGTIEKTNMVTSYSSFDTFSDINFLISKKDLPTNQKKMMHVLGLTTSLTTKNMHLFDSTGMIRKYESTNQILEEYFKVRLALYEQRKEVFVSNLRLECDLLDNKLTYINCVNNGDIEHGGKGIEEYSLLLEKKNFFKHMGGYEYLFSMHLVEFSKAGIELRIQLESLHKRVEALNEKSPQTLWLEDLRLLEQKIDDLYKEKADLASPPANVDFDELCKKYDSLSTEVEFMDAEASLSTEKKVRTN